MARPTATPGQELSVDNVNLDDLSLDDDALFADLDNEVRLEGSGDESLALGGKDDLDLNFDVEALPAGNGPSGNGGKTAAKSGNGKVAAKADDLNLDLDETKLSDGDINLDLDEGTASGGDFNLDLDGETHGGGDLNLDLDGGTGGELNLDLNTPAGSQAAAGHSLDLDISDAAAPAATGGSMMDLDIPGTGGGDDLNLELEPPQAEEGAGEDMLNLELGEPAAPKDMPMSDELDLTLDMDEPGSAASTAGSNDLDLNLDLDEPAQAGGDVAMGMGDAGPEAAPAAGDPELESFELDMGEASMTTGAAGVTGMAAMGSAAAMDLEDRSRPKGADELEEMTLSDESAGPVGMSPASGPVLDLGALPTADEVEAPKEEFQAMPDLDLDSVDLNLDQTASEFKAVPDVDLDTVDLSLNMPLAETHGDAGAPIAPVVEMAEPEAGPRMFTGMGTGAGSKLEVAKEELLELNLADLEARPAGAPAMAMPQMAARPQMPVPAPAAEAPAVAGTDVGSVLMSIAHQVQVRMGSVSLLGQDILNLAHGSVVPLNRAIGEPVDLTLEGKTIAQGEIVVINGRNLGVRIVALSK